MTFDINQILKRKKATLILQKRNKIMQCTLEHEESPPY